MTLEKVALPLDFQMKLPGDVRAFVSEGHKRVADLMDDLRDDPLPSFVPSDFRMVFIALQAVVDLRLAPGDVFCEWGSGFGVVACMAAMLDFQSYGIEIHEQLVDEATQLAEDYELPVEFVCGTFIPRGEEAITEEMGSVEYVLDGGRDAYDELSVDPSDFDLVFAYPWPGGERAIDMLFDRVASRGALLMTYHGVDEIRLQRKID
jgi:hypothetical protein